MDPAKREIYIASRDNDLLAVLTLDISKKVPYIMTLSVKENFRRVGIGKALVIFIQQKFTQLCLNCLTETSKFYIKLGFRVIAYRKAFYDIFDEKLDAYEMIWHKKRLRNFICC